MQHPFIKDLDSLSTQDLSEKITDLYKKLRIASSSGNAYVCDQIKMALESYEIKYQERIRQDMGDDDSTYQDNIDIS